jgi:uncharacterized membrane protein
MLFLTWVAFLLRVALLAQQSLWRDEVDAIRFSAWSLPELVTGLFQQGHNGPLFFILLRFWRNLSGDSEFALRYPSAVLGVLTIPLGFVLARQLGLSRRVGLLVGLLLTTSPYLVWYSQEAKMYALLLVLVSVAFMAYLKALAPAAALPLGTSRNNLWVWWLIFVAATSLSFYTHILAPLMLPVYVLLAWLHWPALRHKWRGWLTSLACLTLPYVPLAWWQAPLLVNGFQTGHPFYPLNQQISLLLQLYSSGLLRTVGSTGIILFVFLWLCGLFLRERTSYSRTPYVTRLTLALWTLLPPLIVYLISLRVQIFEDRYLIHIVPGFYLLVILGLIRVREYSPPLAGLCLGLMLSINLIGMWQQQRQPIKADFRAAAAYLSSQPQPPSPIMVQMPYLQYTLNYYYKQNYQFLEGLWTNNGKSEAAVDAEMRTLTAGLTDLWLITSEEETWDQRRLTRAWLNTHAELVDQASFMRVEVSHYRFRPGVIESQSVGSSVK